MGEGMQDREILESAKSPASRQLWVQAGLCVCVRGSGAALSKLRSTHGDVKLASKCLWQYLLIIQVTSNHPSKHVACKRRRILIHLLLI